MRLHYLKGLFSAKPLTPNQHALVVQSLALMERCELSAELLKRLRRSLAGGRIRANEIAARAFTKEFPLTQATIEINFELLCPSSFDAQEQRGKLRALLEKGALEQAAFERKSAWADQRERELLLDLASLLVHEGTHLVEGRTWSRVADETKAYRAEEAFLKAVARLPGYQDLVETRLAVLSEEAAQEGVRLVGE